ncbi:glycosyltransferase family 1 protein [Sphingomonas sp. AP4-R1]|uniref:glycosyltransferase family 4 protein n=1 Tax=Sphingomonas sp. AP4-R1 TaxID=2735134 RepID=UPI001493D210|nr:glycosyltransferase family 1 protein [Sphingomonas sp. AP4-R1]QJU58196.1 glycosyltransferase family 1 protein [Sphingomonas sp. AP4-R1]
MPSSSQLFLQPSSRTSEPRSAPPIYRSWRGTRLRVALFSGNYDGVRDGANQALNRLVGHLLEEADADVRIYAPRYRKPAFPAIGDLHPVASVPLPIGGRSEYRIALGLPAAARRDLEAFRPNLIHVSAPDLLGRQAQLFARARGIPLVASFHTRFATYLEHYRLSFLRPAIERYLDRFYDANDHILVPNLAIANELAARLGPRKAAIWSRGVDRERFHPRLRSPAFRQSMGYAADEIVPLFFGRLVLEKGLGMFVETIAALRRQCVSVRPLIVGDGPARRWMAKRLPNATFLGHLDDVRLGMAVASADILINPSRTEAFGNVNLEAMASGVAVVSADVASASALIDHGRTGWLVADQTPASYARTALHLAGNTPLRRAVGSAASAAADAFSWEKCLSGVVDVYRALVSRVAVEGAG